MKIIVLGTGDFAVPSLKILAASEEKPMAVVTMPVRTREKGRNAASLIRETAISLDIPVFEPDDINSSEGIALLRRLAPDLVFICDYGKILSPEIIGTSRLGGMNLHGSILPKYRGAAPVHRAILAGETVFGVTVFQINPAVDAGGILSTATLEADDSHCLPEIEASLARLGAPLVLDAVRAVRDGTARPIPQDSSQATRAPKIRKEEGKIDWNLSARELRNRYRAFQPWPKTFCYRPIPGRGEVALTRLIVGPLSVLSENQEERDEKTLTGPVPGEIVRADKSGIVIQTGHGRVLLTRLQPAGKREMSADEFLRGYRLVAGEIWE